MAIISQLLILCGGRERSIPYDQLVLMVFSFFFRLGIPEWGVSATPPAQLDQAQGPILAHPPPSLFCTFYLKHVFSALHNQILNLFSLFLPIKNQIFLVKTPTFFVLSDPWS
jgi:hypothetical protein